MAPEDWSLRLRSATAIAGVLTARKTVVLEPHRSSTEDGRVGRAVTAGEGGRIPVPVRGRPPGYRARWPWPTPARRDGLRLRNRGTLSIFAPAKLGDRSRPGAGISATHTRSDVRQKCYPGVDGTYVLAVRFLGKSGEGDSRTAMVVKGV